jgi:hypothetical protein
LKLLSLLDLSLLDFSTLVSVSLSVVDLDRVPRYSLADRRCALVPGHPVPFESTLLEGHFFLALKQDKGMDSGTHQVKAHVVADENGSS